jgi:quercetin dioxygenase-like cupin family protein
MTESILNRRNFNRTSLISLLTAVAMPDGTAAAQQQATSHAATRRDVIRQELPGEPLRDISLVEVTYPPATGSPPHLHANGVMAFVVSGTIVSKVGDGAEQTFHAGGAWWEPPGAIHRVSRNASSTDPATLLAIYVAPKSATADDLMKPI